MFEQVRRMLMLLAAFCAVLGMTGGRVMSEERAPSRILILGDSLTEGFGVERGAAYPTLLEQRAREAGYPVQVINGGLSGDTSAGGVRRISWLLRQPVDVFVLALGANDGLRGLDPAAMEANLLAIIQKVKEKDPDASIVVAGMEALPNLGERYATEYRAVFPRVAQRSGAFFVPFLLEGVAGEERLNQPDHLHPNEDGHKAIATALWPQLKRVLDERARRLTSSAAAGH